MPLRFATTVIAVKNNAKAVLDFYQQAFDIAIKYYDEDLDFGELDTGATSIMIQSHKAIKVMLGDVFDATNSDKPENVELAFISEDVAASYQQALKAGAQSVRPPTTHEWGQTTAYVTSIEGTLIALVTQPPTDS